MSSVDMESFITTLMIDAKSKIQTLSAEQDYWIGFYNACRTLKSYADALNMEVDF